MARLCQFGHYLWGICLGEKLPVWATLLGIIIGAVATALGTYLIVPSINQNLERQKIRTDFVIRNLDDLNSRTRTLVSDVSNLHYTVLRSGTVDDDVIQKLTSRIAEMQWKAIELAVIFEGSKGSQIVRAYQTSLDDVRTALLKLKSKSDLELSQQAIESFSRRSLDVIRELAGLGGLRVNAAVPKT